MVQLTTHFTSDKPFLKYKFGSLAMLLWRKLKVKCIIGFLLTWTVLMENWIMLWYFPSQQQFSYLQQIQSGQSSAERKGSLSTNEKEKISAMRKKNNSGVGGGGWICLGGRANSLPHLGVGFVLRLLAESEHLSFASLPRTSQPLLPSDKLFTHVYSGTKSAHPDRDTAWSCPGAPMSDVLLPSGDTQLG